jgi:hypothetical protein
MQQDKNFYGSSYSWIELGLSSRKDPQELFGKSMLQCQSISAPGFQPLRLSCRNRFSRIFFLAAKNIIGRSLATTIEKMSAVTGLLAVLSSNKIVSFYNHAGSKPAA